METSTSEYLAVPSNVLLNFSVVKCVTKTYSAVGFGVCVFCRFFIARFLGGFTFGTLTLLVGQQEGHPVCKKLSDGVLAWLSVWSKVQLMPLPLTVSCFSKIQIGFTFLIPAHPASPGKRAVKCVCF